MSPTICLNMIVKNEAGVIRRCLASVRPYVQRWAIVDTGSTDGTQELICRELAGLPGQLHERPWQDFGHNRSEALGLARARADYLLMIDADEELSAPPGFVLPPLTAEAYFLRYRLDASTVSWYRPTLVSTARPWRYQGQLHEYLTCDGPHSSERLEGLMVKSHSDGARNVDPARKYADDARILERAVAENPADGRSVFYLAQSYRDLGALEKALASYERRIALGGWHEEVWYAMFQIAVLKQRLGHEPAAILDAHLRAYQFHPGRAEPLCALAARCRATNEWTLAELFARAAVAVAAAPPAGDVLFVDGSVYEWRALDELAIAAYYVGKFRESIDLNLRLLAEGRLPDAERPRIAANLGFAADKLGAPARAKE